MRNCIEDEKVAHLKQVRGSKGFALIASLSIMILLVMITVGMLTLSTSEVRSANQHRYLQEAQANARMALIIAIGELQEIAGTDLVTTSLPMGSMIGSAIPDSKSQVLGVFSSERYEDKTNPLNWSTRAEDSFKGWLISGDKRKDFKSIGQEYSSPDLITFTAFNAPIDKKVQAPVEAVSKDGKLTGGFAWWVTGLDMTASVNLIAEAEEESEHLSPPRFELAEVAKDRGVDLTFEDSDLAKLYSFKTAELFASGRGLDAESDWLNSAHFSLLTNPIDGGLKKDLTVAFDATLKDRQDALGKLMFPPATTPNDPDTSTPADPGGPNWEQAVSYVKASGTSALPVRAQTPTEAGFYPVIASFVEMYGISNTQGYSPAPIRNTQYVMTMHMAPVIKLWNPYNRELAASDYTITVGNNNQKNGDKGTDDTLCVWRDHSGRTITRYAPGAMRYEHSYYIPSVSLEPGEVKIFSLGGNVFANASGNSSYRPSSGASVDPQKDLVESGYILADLVESVPSGYSVWDMHFTRKNIGASPLTPLSYARGRCEGPASGISFPFDGSDTFIFDTRNQDYDFRAEPGDMLNWSLKLYKGRVSKIDTESNPPRPLVTVENINTSSKMANGSFEVKDKSDIKELANPNTEPFFDTLGTNDESIWVRKFALRHLVNQGDDEGGLYNAGQHGTKQSRFLADFNPRASTIGIWPEEYTKNTGSNVYPNGRPLTIDGEAVNPEERSLATPGGYISGIITNLGSNNVSIGDVTPQAFIGFSDEQGSDRCVLFEVPETSEPEKYFFSVGQLRHANYSTESSKYMSQITNHYGLEDYFSDNNRPTYVIGESFADIRLGTSDDYDMGKYRQMDIVDGSLQGQSTFYDMSWYMNRYLWDNYFFSARKSVTESHNPRIVVEAGRELGENKEDINLNASKLLVAGTLSVNCTSEEAWKAFLLSAMGAAVDGESDDAEAPVSRFHKPLLGKVEEDAEVEDDEVYAGYRVINADEATELAKNIVKEIEKRGPFYSVSDFINRATIKGAPTDLRVKGALQAAIDESSINELFEDHKIKADDVGSIYDNQVYQGHSAVGVPGYLTQGDICARLGHLLTSRTDTFRVRTYGRSVDSSGRIIAEAWCEAEVQRIPEYVDRANTPDTVFKDLTPLNKKNGRRFVVTNFRWLNTYEISGPRS